MPIIDGITIDQEWWTADSESDPRARPIRILQPHHAATTSLAGARSLMDPGGRTVSSNGLLDVDGTLYGVVRPNRRAFTSATTFDHDSFTVECVNSSGAPTWGLTDAQHERLAKIAVEIASLNNRAVGDDMIVQHKFVPGTYATACAGPSYNQATVLAYAQLISGSSGSGKKDTMRLVFVKALTQNTSEYQVLIDGQFFPFRGTQAEANAFAAANGPTIVPSAFGLTFDQFKARFAGGVSGGSVDLSPVLAAIAAGEQQDVAAQAELLKALAQTPAATLAAFGLKRA